MWYWNTQFCARARTYLISNMCKYVQQQQHFAHPLEDMSRARSPPARSSKLMEAGIVALLTSVRALTVRRRSASLGKRLDAAKSFGLGGMKTVPQGFMANYAIRITAH
jgi:hypothetical protein